MNKKKHLNVFTVRYLCNEPWLDRKMEQLTNCQQQQLADNIYPVITVDNFNDINEFIDDANFLFIQAAGDVVADKDCVWDLLHMIPPNVGLIGHILWDPVDSTPHLHHQCIIINTKALKGKRFDFYGQTNIGKQFIRSEQSFHGNYCPAWVKLGQYETARNPKFGTDLMSLILENGFDVVNFDKNWREIKNVYNFNWPARGFFNQDIRTELFLDCFKTLTEDETLDPAQLSAIKIINNELECNSLYAYHWDSYPVVGNINLVMCPANGFMGECIAMANNAEKIIFYDINKNNIDFKRKLYLEWDANDYEAYYTKFANERGLIIEPSNKSAKKTATIFNNEVQQIINNWDQFKKMDVEFIHCDFISKIDCMLDKIVDNTILHTSTILTNYMWSNMLHDVDEIETVRSKITKKILATSSIWHEI